MPLTISYNYIMNITSSAIHIVIQRGTAVINLFRISRPSTIFFTIMTIIVNSFNGSVFFPKFFNMLKIRIEHVILKFLNTFPKDFNTSATVTLEPTIFGIIASLLHLIESLSNGTIVLGRRSMEFHTYSLAHEK